MCCLPVGRVLHSSRSRRSAPRTSFCTGRAHFDRALLGYGQCTCAQWSTILDWHRGVKPESRSPAALAPAIPPDRSVLIGQLVVRPGEAHSYGSGGRHLACESPKQPHGYVESRASSDSHGRGFAGVSQPFTSTNPPHFENGSHNSSEERRSGDLCGAHRAHRLRIAARW